MVETHTHTLLFVCYTRTATKYFYFITIFYYRECFTCFKLRLTTFQKNRICMYEYVCMCPQMDGYPRPRINADEECYFICLSKQINLSHVFKMSAFGTHTCFDSCTPLVNGCVSCELFRGICCNQTSLHHFDLN